MSPVSEERTLVLEEQVRLGLTDGTSSGVFLLLAETFKVKAWSKVVSQRQSDVVHQRVVDHRVLFVQ